MLFADNKMEIPITNWYWKSAKDEIHVAHVSNCIHTPYKIYHMCTIRLELIEFCCLNCHVV